MAATRASGRKYIVLYMTLISLALADDCLIGNYTITLLKNFNPWKTINSLTGTVYEISLCEKLSSSTCPDGTAVCAQYKNGTAKNFGSFNSTPSFYESPQGADGELLVSFRGEVCEKSEFYSTILYFKCGKTLGYPKYLGEFPCSAHFEWASYLFCKKLPVPEKEVPCAAVKGASLIDLTPLIKLNGGYTIESKDDQTDILINVCREITEAGNDKKNCTKGSAVCKIKNKVVYDFGNPKTKLEATSDGVRLVYASSSRPSTCSMDPTTTVNFICPKRGGSKSPVLLTDFAETCSMIIEWVTEYACPAEYLTSDQCHLTESQHGINIDLSDLKRKPDDPYIVNATDGEDHYVYYLNVCDNVVQCDKTTTPVCQRKSGFPSFQNSVGMLSSQQLTYSDGDLILSYRNGDSCGSNFKRETVIEFVCNQSAVDNGKGYPEFVEHSNCSYFFKWGTKHACVEHASFEDCKVESGGKKYDLSALIRSEGNNWEVITGENDNEKSTYFLNVCHDVLHTDLALACPAGSAVCRIGSSGAQSVGQLSQGSLKYNPSTDSLTLTYTGGANIISHCRSQTVINLYCSPGNAVNPPKLIRKDDCFFEIEWYTSAACVLSRKTGDGCRLEDSTAGYVYDLNPLKKDSGDYTVNGTDGYTYLINVCSKINDDKHCVTKPHDNASICQIKAGTEFKVAEPSTQLEYFDGILNLTYTNGERYNNAEKTPRTAEIAFVCDPAVDIGNPEFLEEKNFTYAFLWRTSYACTLAPVECAVTNDETHEQFDLSSLSKVSGVWEAEIPNDSQGRRTKFYINVCRPLGHLPNLRCSPFSSVCATYIDSKGNETIYHGNLGKAMSAPVYERSSRGLKLVYTSGENCTDSDGTVKRFTTTIHFICMKGNLVGGPSEPQVVSPCEYSILWETEAACPVTTDHTKAGNGSECTVRDSNTDFLFNLLPLKKPDGYNVTSADGSQHFKLNLCGSLPDTFCGKYDQNQPTGICNLKTEHAASVASSSAELVYSGQGELTLTYRGRFDMASSNFEKYAFSFVCDRTAQQARITYLYKRDSITAFKVNTSLACPPQPVNCVVEDASGQQFDLTPLARETGNWEVVDVRPSHSHLKYHINVCRPVNPTPSMTCPGGAVGGCQTSTSGDESFNMGWVQSEPVASGAAVTLHYEGGDKCHAGKDTESYRSTRIIFFCDAVEHNPIFQSESDTCEYTFIWKTPSACPQKVVVGDDCKVTDPLYNYQFDLNTLRNSTSDYSVEAAGYKFFINLCGPLLGSIDQCQSAAACQTGPSLQTPVPIGLPNKKLKYTSGQMTLTYSDGKGSCHQKYERKTIINFICDHSVSGRDGPRYLEEKSDCTYVFEWTASAVCPPHQVVDCIVQNGDDVYDLSRLSLSNTNYEKMINDSNQLFVINICRSLVHRKGHTCPFDSAACRIDLSETDPSKMYHNIGKVTNQTLSLEQGILVLRYENGEPCGSGRRSTVILFQCDEQDNSLGTPGGHFEINGCQDHFVWKSSAACPQKAVEPDTGFGDCTVTNLNTGYKFDLSSLKKAEGYTVYDRDGHEFILNVCGWVSQSTGCANGTGACQVSQIGPKAFVNTGAANARPVYKDGVIALEYRGGDQCNARKVSRETYINFVCDQDAGTGVPVYIDRSDDCIFYFQWETQLVCEKEVKCEAVTDQGSTLDFSHLILKSGQYDVLPVDAGSHHLAGTIFINLCRPLNPVYGTLCPPGSAACLLAGDGKLWSLGRVDQEPVYDRMTKEVKLTYTRGDPCPSNQNVNITSVIILKCGNSKELGPELEGVTSDCEYVFMWETRWACPESSSQKLTTPDCRYKDHQMNTTYDLSSLSDTYSVQASKGGTFKLQPCGRLDDEKVKSVLPSCADSSVCMVDLPSWNGSYGDTRQGKFQKDSTFLTLTFSQGRPCSSKNSQAMSTIYFECDRTAGKGQPKLMADDECQVTFQWKTDLVCPVEKLECLITSKGLLFDFSILSRESSSWNFTDNQKNVYWLNLCQGLHGQALDAKCPRNAAVCRRTANSTQMLGQLDTQQMLAQSLSPTSSSVTITYSQGDADVCSAGGRRRSDIPPKVVITLTCGNTIGQPFFESFSTSECIFKIGWKTRMACAVSHDKMKVKEVRGLVYDVRTGLSINVKPLLDPTNQHVIHVDDDHYAISMGQPVQLDTKPAACAGAAVCLKSGASYKNLGAHASLSYFMEDEHLEVVFTSPEKCQGSQSHMNITSIISFHCSDEAESSSPEFLYKTLDCVYMFHWDTNVVCFNLDQNLSDDPTNADVNDNGGKVAIGVSVLVFIALVCVFVLIMYKPERRALIASKLKRVITCRKRQDAQIVYSRLSQAEPLDDDPFNPFPEQDEESEINNGQLPSKFNTFHDDSDEDMLL